MREALAARKLPARHALDLLYAFRMDATKTRYANFDELMHYCAYSARPSAVSCSTCMAKARATWPANDALCSALQIINHTQDCGADYRNLDRVYIPQDMLARHGTDVTALGADKATPALLACLHELSARTEKLVAEGRTLVAASEGFAAFARNRGDRTPCADARDPFAKARSAEPERASEQARIPRLDARRRRRWFHRPHQGRVQRGHDASEARMSVAEAAPPATAQTRASGSSFYAAMRILPRAQRDGDVRDLFVLPPCRRHRR